LTDLTATAGLDPATARSLLRAAIAVRQHAYVPYSHFPVGAALLARDGRVFTGVNVENASYGLAQCAERVAIGKAVSEGVHDFVAIAVVGPEDEVACTPCGACRQVLHEFGGGMLVVTADGDSLQVRSADDLLPGAFDASRLTGRGRTV
jgi:cytidine deaminase